MAQERTKIEDYAFLSDTQTAALVSRDGCVDWLCLPRFDSPACFASLLGDTKNGHWRFFPEEEVVETRRRYRGDSLILETEIETKSGAVRLIDFMPPRGENPDIIRIVEGLRGKVSMQMELVIRFDYGQIVPWVRHRNGGLEAIAGPDGLILRTPIETHGKDLTTLAEFTVSEGERVPFVLTWFASHKNPPRAIHYEHALRDTEQYWREWCNQFQGQGKWRDAVMRSLIVLKGLTYAPTGGLVAAATTSLPEQIGGPRNWDYRYCWLRDATFALLSLLRAVIARRLRDGVSGCCELSLAALPKCRSCTALAASAGSLKSKFPGFQAMKSLCRYASATLLRLNFSLMCTARCWRQCSRPIALESKWRSLIGRLIVHLMKFLESNWQKPDEGIWEVRGGRKNFTHSKMMAWVAFDCAVKLVEECGCAAGEHHARWRKVREQIRAEVCERGYNSKRKAFTQFYGSDALDASLLTMPLVGFLPATDERVRNTVEAIERELMEDGLVLRYRPQECGVDGLPGREGVFLPCSFWLVACWHLLGRKKEARELFERLLDVRNDLGLLSEEYDPREKRQLGNFPQAFSHVALLGAARILDDEQETATSI